MKANRFISLLLMLGIVFCFPVSSSAKSAAIIFDGDLKNYPGNWSVSAVPEESNVNAVYGTHDSIRGNSVKLDVPANTCYRAVSAMESVSAADASVVMADLTIMLTETTAEKQIVFGTKDETSSTQPISLLTITNKGALKLGDASFSTDYFKFGTWANGHYNIKLYYFAKLGKAGVNIQRLKYAKGTPVDKEWTFTAPAPKSEAIDSVAFQIDNAATGSSRTDIFNFSLTKLSEADVHESIINSQRRYDFNDLDTMSIKNNQTSGFHTSYYGWYTQNTSGSCNAAYANMDDKKVLKLFTDGTKYLDLVKYFDLSLSYKAVIEADVKLEQGSVIDLTVRGPKITDGSETGKSLIHFEEGKAMLLGSVEISGFEYGKWFRVSVYIDDTGDTPYAKAKLINLETGDTTQAETQFDFIDTIKYINTFKITPAYGKPSAIYVDNISFSEKNAHRVMPDFETGSTIYSDEVSFTSTTFNIDKSKSSVILNGVEADLASITTEEFNNVKIKVSRQATPYTMEYTLFNYWGDKVESTISFTCPMDSFYDFEYDKSSIESGTLTCTAKAVCASGKYEKATMLTILYDLSSNLMHTIDLSYEELSGTPVIITTSVEVPDDGKKYKAVTYLIDDMINMNSLSKSIELK